MTASGLAPNAPLTVVLDGRQLSYGDGSTPRADAAGSFAGSFATPALAVGTVQLRHVLVVSDETRRPRARFTVTRPAGADFQPSSGDPRTLRARFRVWGFACATPAAMPVWLHWVSPRGTVRRNAALGTTGGDCGALTHAPRRVFPFAPEAGRWVLVLDTHRRYRVQAAGPRAKIPVHVRSLPPERHAPPPSAHAPRRRRRARRGARRRRRPCGAETSAKIVLDPGCYLSNGSGLLTGSGFRPNSSVDGEAGRHEADRHGQNRRERQDPRALHRAADTTARAARAS